MRRAGALAAIGLLATIATACGDGERDRGAGLVAKRRISPDRQGLAPLPRGWPRTLVFGLVNGPGELASLTATPGFGARYQYLSGGVNTGKGWLTYAPGGTFVDNYVRESNAGAVLPVLTYYMLLQSLPGAAVKDERRADAANLASQATMAAYLADLEQVFRHAAQFAPAPVVVHIEPDLWGYAEQLSPRTGASGVRVRLPRTQRLFAGLPDDLSGLARAIVRLRDSFAPNVLLGYQLSDFGTGKDLAINRPSSAEVDVLAARAAAFYRSLRAPFDLLFAEWSNRDYGYSVRVKHQRAAVLWNAADYARQLRFLAAVTRRVGLRSVIWQIPVGNTIMRASDNTPFHYQDNHVQWLLGTSGRAHLREYVRAGVVGFLFGAALPRDTCACDAARDGITNPAPIDGNTVASYSADDDGGYLRHQLESYARTGPIALPAR